MVNRIFRPFVVGVWGVTLIGLSGCSTISPVQPQHSAHFQAFRFGEFEQASRAISERKEIKQPGKNALLWQLEYGAVLRAANQLEASNEAFEKAYTIFQQRDEEARLRASAAANQAAAAVTNPNVLRYRAYSHEQIMLHLYKTLNFVELRDVAAARVELNRAHSAQKLAVERNRKRIASEKKSLNEKGASISPETQEALGPLYQDATLIKAYQDYVNPMMVFLDALVFGLAPQDGSDVERARKSLKRLSAMLDNEAALKPLVAHVGASLKGDNKNSAANSPLVIVLFENGLAPVRQEARLDLPIVIKGSAQHIGIAFPKIVDQSPLNPHLSVKLDKDSPLTTTVVCDVSQVVRHAYKNELPRLITQAVLPAVGRAVLQAQVNRAAKDQPGADIVQLGTFLYGLLANRADVRSWVTVPHEWQMAMVKRPPNNQITLTLPKGGKTIPIALPTGEAVLVLAKSTSLNDLSVRTCVLRLNP